ncbi:mechanosensitive ion channel protein MscS [Methanocella sp. CWC-04]|uniref:Mechanosensitive ion channel protein MscS n=1 Tax=Methanooceanicella nereidis TaxID=2052831 RepID=A0AAP2W7E8_9EURY|nr:mechanosensitive ion channel domain-containing protein [Methanocella sp. CWC-04]MCD1296352.1 mechanosensitive ion channel protein MscS [Methanocella sp. CWC-04]
MKYSQLKVRIKYLVITILILASAAVVLLIPFFYPGLGAYITILAVGASLALQKYIASFVGFFVIRWSSIFDVGDRIRIGNVKGDVKHIGLFHIIVDEVGEDEKLGGELTGRIFHIPNLLVLDQPVLNFSKDFSVNEELISCGYIFDEIRIPLSTKSDINKAISVLDGILRAENMESVKAAKVIYEKGLPNFMKDIENGPKIMIHIDEEKIWIKGKFVTQVRDRNMVKTRISLRFIESIRDDETIQIAK